MKKQRYFVIAAFIIGIVSALLAYKLHSIFFVLIPLWAFAFGYFASSKRWGLLYGFLLFVAYTTTIGFIHHHFVGGKLSDILPFEYLYNFILGGFLLLLLGAFAPVIRKRKIKNIRSVLVVALLVITIGYCGYTAFPRYSYSYTGEIVSPDMSNITEIYFPMISIAQEPYTEILQYDYLQSHDYQYNLTNTDQGQMFVLSSNAGKTLGGDFLSDYVSFQFDQEKVSRQAVELFPKFEKGIRTEDGNQYTVFKSPIKVIANDNTNVSITVTASNTMMTNINFCDFKFVHHMDTLEFQGEIVSSDWIFSEGKTISSSPGVSGPSGY